ncbi:MAG: alpha amylase C-terminal domain-containing protein [Bacteroidales bacterium]|nr:alpha amylase C-terminal domain-containing protein [Bacteroidales bacterium]
MTNKGQYFLNDPWLEPYRDILKDRQRAYEKKLAQLSAKNDLVSFASGHLYYGMHSGGDSLTFREWAPDATAIYLTGSFNNWEEKPEYAMTRINTEGDWELSLPAGAISHGDLYKLSVHWKGGSGERIPSYARTMVQDEETKIFSCRHWQPGSKYKWKHPSFSPGKRSPLIYECHTGMSSEEEKIATFNEFRENVLPRIAAGGYNTIQLMAVQEHPYYGSFGYHVSNFFAVSSRFGSPDDLRALIDEAHGMGLAVIIDLVHSHSVSNINEGLGLFDGDPGQYFHSGERRLHTAWNSLCFDYGKDHVIHFLLSNIRYWMEEYKVDGFRFDGITSMLYYDHGLEKNFTSYDMYYDGGQDIDALIYLKLANKLVHSIKPDAISIAEEMSGMPGIACDIESGGTGFDLRLAMGIPDYWIKIIKEKEDENWDMDELFHELTTHRQEEKTVSYCESHDQALVGDKTLMFRLADAHMYTGMAKDSQNMQIDRAIALHKMIRLITICTAGGAYLNFMGNEFGHPEWIDFPREGNNWSYKYARRQWSLAGREDLKYRYLDEFDRHMIQFVRESRLLSFEMTEKVYSHNKDNILAFRRGRYLMVFNFHPSQSFTAYRLPAEGRYKIVLDTDHSNFGGYDRLDRDMVYISSRAAGEKLNAAVKVSLYLPSRTGIILEMLPARRISQST